MTIRWWRRWREVRATLRCRNCRRLLWAQMWVKGFDPPKLFATKAWQAEMFRRYMWSVHIPCLCDRRLGSEDVLPWKDGCPPATKPRTFYADDIAVFEADDGAPFFEV